ncbi:glycoside hydrolase family 3 N-terminal domain-containing protein [Cellulomonas sp. PhB143]|uniref:beta-xylosidase/alpha-l-arabinosidase n=1 Tax=Cellulomonas sp. PhB143 TaxID=2485186 RepID=UPI000F48EFED|nr:glycoside hydrolase family 3 N-terminal domain-containing protein [Cellulomonas sp. PhB143]ROS76880.1 beta-glucosidase [Cellulomonas sp. PhB143]
MNTTVTTDDVAAPSRRPTPPGTPSAAERTRARERAAELLGRMTLEEKVAQIVGVWVDQGGEGVAPMQGEMAGEVRTDDDGLRDFARHGLGQITRAYGTRPVEPAERRRWLQEMQRWLVTRTRLGIPALAHEECLTGLAAWKATTFPTPLAWGAAWAPEVVERMGAAIGTTMRSLGVHQGLAPVLDVIRDARWGRVEECISEDPLAVGTIGTAYVRGLQSAGIVATLKHFVGYSASRAGRNLAPVHAGPRELLDTLLVPFEIAVVDGGVRSVMPSYAEIDGLPVAADPRLLTDLLRERWGFEGTVVADYFEVAFLQHLHGVAADLGDAAGQALAAGIDVELPTGNAYLAPLVERVRSGAVDEALVDRAVLRHLAQKAELGLLDETFDGPLDDGVDLDPAAHRAIARELAEASVVLVTNDGTLPLSGPGRTPPARVAVVGPNADRAQAMFGCYSFTNHVLGQHPGTPLGIEVATLREALGAELGAPLAFARGCAVDDDDRSGIAEAVAVARDAETAVVVVGDQAGLFGRGTVGEGCDRDSLELPGVQRELVEAVLETGTPVVLVLLTGRPYAVDWAVGRCAAVVQAFFPGEEGAGAVAGVLSGRVNPSGRMPVSLPRSSGAQPYSYLHPVLGGPGEVSNLENLPVVPFGHGLSYTSFVHEDLVVEDGPTTSGGFRASVTVRNTGDRAGDDVVQLYARDTVASVTRPTAQLVAFSRVALAPGGSARVTFRVPAARLALADRDLVRVVEPGDVELWVGPSCTTKEATASLVLAGEVHRLTVEDARLPEVEVERG